LRNFLRVIFVRTEHSIRPNALVQRTAGIKVSTHFIETFIREKHNYICTFARFLANLSRSTDSAAKGFSDKKVQNESVVAFISLGSNLGDRAGNLLLAVRAMLEANFEVLRLSAVYETEAGHEMFLNMVAEVRVTNITPEQMMARMIRIEYLLGRRDKNLKQPRTVDLDLLFYGNLQYQSPFLTLPHPRLHLRRFVLVPFAELEPHFVHPVINRSIQEILAHTEDKSAVKRWKPV
jgi:2-amino-4-hydroxy-6-hydroxymethyldihydropteridine diphosphokinase